MKTNKVQYPHHLAFVLFLISLLLTSCDIPKDPEKTLESIKGKKLIVGIVENPPWSYFSKEEPQGLEVLLVKSIAKDLGATIEWVKGSESELFQSLIANQVHLVIGGISKKNPWSKQVGFTNPYLKEKIYVGVAANSTPIESIKHKEVGVSKGNSIAKYVKKKEAYPTPVEDLERFHGPIAGYEHEILAIGYQTTDIELHEDQKVFAVPQGENAWVLYLEDYFKKNKSKIDDWLINSFENEKS